MRRRDRRDGLLEGCAALPAAQLTYPFGDSTAVFKVGGKMFALVSLAEPPGQVTLKCEPDEAAALCRTYEAITPGYHMNKRHWITIGLGDSLPGALLSELVRGSYELVVASLPVKLRPAPA